MVTVDPPSAGIVYPTTFDLDAANASFGFYGCNATQDPTCPTSAVLNLAFASEPDVVLAESAALPLIVPTPVGDPTPCLQGGNVIYLDGDPNNQVFSGQVLVPGVFLRDELTQSIDFEAPLTGAPAPDDYYLSLGSENVTPPNARPIASVYENASSTVLGPPFLVIALDEQFCADSSGSKFQIEDLVTTDGAFTRVTATFEFYCQGSDSVLRGCVHYDAPDPPQP